MKRIRKATFKTTFIGRNGKKRVSIPVTSKKTNNNGSKVTRTATNNSSSSVDSAVFDLFNENPVGFGMSSHSRRQVNLLINWGKIRGDICDAYVEESSLSSESLCVICSQNNATIRCKDCGPRQCFCRTCAMSLHSERNQFHLLEIWKNEMFVPLYPDHGVIKNGHHNCDTKSLKQFTLIDSCGIKHIKKVEVCECEPHAITLIKCGFWPGSPKKPTAGFHMNIMNMMEKVFLQSQVSVHDFSEVLELLQPELGYKTLTSMYSILSSGCFEEYRLFKYKLNYLDTVCTGLSNGAHCPLCPEDEGILIESMDACMGLVRKKCKGSRLLESRHGNIVFNDQVDVDNFVNNYQKDGEKYSEDCSRFHAGEVLPSLRSKGRNKVFDEKGVFGRVCRHDFPKGFINLKHGERISYSIYELQRLKASLSDKPNIKVIVMYDIACILKSHLKNTSQNDLLSNISLAIPIFHCYGHKASCQVEYNPRCVEGVGLTDGEGVERLWSYLRGFAAMTKEMGLEKRHDVLTDALIFYGQKLCKKFGDTLKVRLLRTEKQVSTIDKELKTAMEAVPTPVSKDLVSEWKLAEMKAIKPQENVLQLTWDESYVSGLLEIQQIKGDLSFQNDTNVEALKQKLKRKEKEVTSCEKKKKIKERWKSQEKSFDNAKQRLISKRKTSLLLKMHRLAAERVFLIEMKKKYADGQGVAIKLSNQITKASNALHKCLSSLNALCDEDAFTFDEAKSPESTIYHQDITAQIGNDQIPHSTKKIIVDLTSLKDRCLEEISLIKVEAIRLFHYYFKQIQIINDFIDSFDLKTPYDIGLKTILLQKKAKITHRLSRLDDSLSALNVSPYIINPVESLMTFSSLVGAVEFENEPEQQTAVDDDDIEFINNDDDVDDASDSDWDSSDSNDFL